MLVFEGLPSGLLGSVLWRFARRAQAKRRRRVRLLEMELRLAAASEVLRQEVFRLKHYSVLGPAGFPLESRINSFNKREFAAIYKGAPK